MASKYQKKNACVEVVVVDGKPVMVSVVQPQKVASSAPVAVALMFRYGKVRDGNEQMRSSFRSKSGKFVQVIVNRDSGIQPEEGEIWVCEVSTTSIAEWVYEDKRSGRKTPSVLVSALPMCQIGVPEQIRFNDIGAGRLAWRVRDQLPGGARLVFIPDNRDGEIPGVGENWKVQATGVVHSIGMDDGDDTIVIAVACLERVYATEQVKSPWSGVGQWSPNHRVEKPTATVAAVA